MPRAGRYWFRAKRYGWGWDFPCDGRDGSRSFFYFAAVAVIAIECPPSTGTPALRRARRCEQHGARLHLLADGRAPARIVGRERRRYASGPLTHPAEIA